MLNFNVKTFGFLINIQLLKIKNSNWVVIEEQSENEVKVKTSIYRIHSDSPSLHQEQCEKQSENEEKIRAAIYRIRSDSRSDFCTRGGT